MRRLKPVVIIVGVIMMLSALSVSAYASDDELKISGIADIDPCWLPGSCDDGGDDGVQYKITALARDGGAIDPYGDVTVDKGQSKTFTIEPFDGFMISDVIVDGTSVGKVSEYTFENVTADHIIDVYFSEDTSGVQYIITAAAGDGGIISPTGEVTVDEGQDQTFTIETEAGFVVADVVIDGDSAGPISGYTFENVTANHSIAVSFSEEATPEPEYTITAAAGDGGTISPSGEVIVDEGQDQTFTIETEAGFVVADVVIDGDSAGPISGYTFENVTEDHSIAVSFSEEATPEPEYTITALAGDGGTISPSGEVIVDEGQDQTFTIETEAGFVVADVVIDGDSAGQISEYTFESVTEDHSIAVSFSEEVTPEPEYTITASAGDGGTISPSGEVIVDEGQDQTFTIETEAGFVVADVVIDGDSAGQISEYTFENVTENHSIAVSFSETPGKQYIITASAGEGGAINPSGEIAVNEGGDRTFGILADDGYEVEDVTVDGESVGAVPSYTFTGVGADHEISAAFKAVTVIEQYKITASAGENGSISPSGEVTVNKDGDKTFGILADDGYEVEDVTVDGESVGAVPSYTFTGVGADHEISAAFKAVTVIEQYKITASAGENGSISPSGEVIVNKGGDKTFGILADEGYEVEDVTVDGESVGAVTSYTFTGVGADHEISAAFKAVTVIEQYKITASAGENGSISPSGEVIVNKGGDKTFGILADEGYEVEDVTVDGESVGAVPSYTFTGIGADHEISAAFKAVVIEQYKITASAGENGNISPSGELIVNKGEDKVFDILPDEGYEIENVTVNGVSVGALTSYTFTDIKADHEISATFKAVTVTEQYKITASAEEGGNISPSGEVVVNKGGSYKFDILPAEGYEIDEVKIDGEPLDEPVAAYTFEDVTDNHTIHIYFKEAEIIQYTITAGAEEGGTVEPSGEIVVNKHENRTFQILPADGYEIDEVKIDGESLDEPVTSYTFEDVLDNHTIHIYFKEAEVIQYTITAGAEEGGTVEPSGEIIVSKHESRTFQILPADGYEIDEVKIDGESLDEPVTSYTFEDVLDNHTIHIYFKEAEVIQYTITAGAEEGGTVEPSGEIIVSKHESRTFQILPADGYEIDEVKIDGESLDEPVTSYTFEDVLDDHTIHIYFKEVEVIQYTITATANEYGTVEPFGEVQLNEGEDITFAIMPSAGYIVESIAVDGEESPVNVRAADEYAFEYGFRDISGDHTIHIRFAEKTVSEETVMIRTDTMQMVSFARWPETPHELKVSGDDTWEYNKRLHVIAAYDPQAKQYVRYGDGLEIEPGKACWFYSKENDLEFTVKGASVNTAYNVDVELIYNPDTGYAWNMIGCPNDSDYNWNDVQVLQYDADGILVRDPMPVSSPENDLVDKKLWRWEGGKYLFYTPEDSFHQDYEEYYDPAGDPVMKSHKGYWVRVKEANVFLRFGSQEYLSAPEAKSAVAASRAADDTFTGGPPAPPDLDSSSSGGGTCFIDSASLTGISSNKVQTVLIFVLLISLAIAMAVQVRKKQQRRRQEINNRTDFR
ncbi:hypothetical protein QUF80_10210 [Desulfococcaceae bacterium HSG8]|nr:hypothetical protein [Desulfococcaceae bacterium HSG8]